MPSSAARRRTSSAGVALAVAALGISALVAPGSASGSAARSHSAPAARYRSATCPNAYPLSQVHAGLRGTGYTTVKGKTPQPFSVRVLGVLHDGIAAGIDMIVISTHSRAITRNGTWEGMSGSPIYAGDGRLIGALSYGLSFGATNKAGVTPAAAMYQLLSDRKAQSTTYAKRVAIPRSMSASDAAGGAGSDPSGDLQLLPTPITVTGLPAAGLSALAQRLRHAGAAPFSLHAGGARGVERHGSAASIRPGAPFAVTTAYGDYTIGGVGTVTAVCKGKVLAFGHPMMGIGATSETANTASVLYVQRDPTGPSFVMANIGPIVGTLDEDRIPGVRASLGARPRATTIVTHVVAPLTGLRRTGVTHTPLVEEVADATGGSTFGNLIATMQSEGAGSSSYSWSASGRLDDGTPWRFHRTDRLTDPFDIPFATSFEMYQTLATIVDNPYDAVTVNRVSVRAEGRETVSEWELGGLSVNQGDGWQDVTPSTVITVAPGDTLQLRATLRAYQNSHDKRTVDLSVHVPAEAASGSGQVLVAGGADLAALGPDTSTATSVADLLKALNAVPHNDDLVAQVSVPDPSGSATITRNHHVRLKKVTRGTLALQLNVVIPCGDCSGDGGTPPAS